MDNSAAFRALVARLQEGEPEAAEELCRRYGPYIRVVVRRYLDVRLRTWFDSLDFVQDVWVSFLAAPRDRYTFETPRALLAFLTRIARDKVADAARQPGVRGEDGTGPRAAPDPSPPAADEWTSPDPSPSEWAIAGERWERLLSRVPAGHRAVLERLRDGYKYEEIARMTKVSPSTIKRIVRRLKELADDL